MTREEQIRKHCSREYPICIYWIDGGEDSDGYYFGYLPDFGPTVCGASGDTQVEVVAALNVSKERIIRSFVQRGRAVPEPTKLDFFDLPCITTTKEYVRLVAALENAERRLSTNRGVISDLEAGMKILREQLDRKNKVEQMNNETGSHADFIEQGMSASSFRFKEATAQVKSGREPDFQRAHNLMLKVNSVADLVSALHTKFTELLWKKPQFWIIEQDRAVFNHDKITIEIKAFPTFVSIVSDLFVVCREDPNEISLPLSEAQPLIEFLRTSAAAQKAAQASQCLDYNRRGLAALDLFCEELFGREEAD